MSAGIVGMVVSAGEMADIAIYSHMFFGEVMSTIHLAFQVSGCKCPFNALQFNFALDPVSEFLKWD